MSARGIYVEASIRAPLEKVWQYTQDPQGHQRWDLRFSTIRYLPGESDAPQKFLYTTRLGFGMEIAGEGETVGTVASPTERTSALHFWSTQTLSLIRDGRGYWKYVDGPTLRFFTWYDYEVRWGFIGRLVDYIVFRSVIGWATACSFDRLRLWAEDDIRPGEVLRASVIYTVVRCAIIFVWFWHGLVPKLLLAQRDELLLLAAQHLPASMVRVAGGAEIAVALLGILTWRWRGYFALSAALMLVALASVTITAPEYLGHAFNPVTLNLSVMALCASGFVAAPSVAFAGRCLRRPPKSKENA